MKPRRAWPLLMAVLGLLAGARCGGGSTLVVISVHPLASDIRSLQVVATVGALHAFQEVSGDLSRFGLVLPEGTIGTMALDVTALKEDRCFSLSGYTEVAVAGEARIDVDIALNNRGGQKCPLLLSRTGAGTGQVTADPPGNLCGPDCVGTYPVGLPVELRAQPDAPFYFAGWSLPPERPPGPFPCGDSGPCKLILDGPVRVTVRFEDNRLTVAHDGEGSGRVSSVPAAIDCGALCDASFPQGTSVQLVATPDPGSAFVGWTGACEGAGPCTVALQAPARVTASFTPLQMLTVEVQGAGGRVLSDPPGIDCRDRCSLGWIAGQKLTLRARAEGPSAFAGWTLAPCGSPQEPGLLAACELSPTGPMHITVRFDPLECTEGWCWENPQPNNTTASQVWGSSATDVWVIADSLLRRWDGASWRTLSSGTSKPLYGVWGSGPADVWAVGSNGKIVHWDGTAWGPVDSGRGDDLFSVWGSAPNNVWAVGGAGQILRWGGAAWAPPTGGSGTSAGLSAVWGSGAGDVWAVGLSGTILHWDGTRWAPTPGGSGTSSNLYAVRGSGPADIWAVGVAGTITHWDGTRWAAWPGGAGTTQNLWGLWGASSRDVWAVGSRSAIVRFDGTRWAALPGRDLTAKALYRVRGSAADDIWAVGEAGTALHWDGASWRVPPGGSGTGNALNGLWIRTGRDAWSVGASGTILHWDGGAWTPVGSGTTKSLGGVWGSGVADVWAVGAAGTVLHWDGASWSSRSLGGGVPTLSDVGGSAPDDVWAVGDTLWHWNGTTWTQVPVSKSPGLLRSLWMSSASDGWAVGSMGLLLRFGGGLWTQLPAFIGSPQGVWGSGPSDLWVGGLGPTLSRWNGIDFEYHQLSPPTIVYDLWGAGPGALRAVGSNGAILRYRP